MLKGSSGGRVDFEVARGLFEQSYLPGDKSVPVWRPFDADADGTQSFGKFACAL